MLTLLPVFLVVLVSISVLFKPILVLLVVMAHMSFHVLAESGEDLIAFSDTSNYAQHQMAEAICTTNALPQAKRAKR